MRSDGNVPQPCLSVAASFINAISIVPLRPITADDDHSVSENDWPFIRRPACDDHSAETGLIDACPAEDPPMLWSRKLGQSYSTYIAVKGRVFTQAQSNGPAVCLLPGCRDRRNHLAASLLLVL